MNNPAESLPPSSRTRGEDITASRIPANDGHPPDHDRSENRRWWLKLFLQPLLFLLCGALLIGGLGAAQRFGWITAAGGGQSHAPAGDSATRYICPMMCTPPQAEPGRCPVCAMELVPATAGAGTSGSQSVQIGAAARRIANIRTVSVSATPVMRKIRAVGELSYNEGALKTISAYVDGRLERLHADYTGVVVEKGDRLALVYSPRLYAAQVEYLLARKTRDLARPSTSQRASQPNIDLYHNTRQRLTELGMTDSQIDELDQRGQASSRLQLYAPNGGTVIEKLAVEGQYVREGEPIYRLADLSTLWLMLKLFPEDAALIRYGQKVEAELHSLPGRQFAGRVAFIDPSVSPATRTVTIRVVLSNEHGLLRAGDLATAVIESPLVADDQGGGRIYDPELAGRSICPRHPHVTGVSPGECPECGVDLVPASELGFTADPNATGKGLTVPRDAILMAGGNNVAYVETAPGRFEMRQVVLGVSSGDRIVVLSGLREGEQVAARGNFLIDSQMQLAGYPSLIDPMKATPAADPMVGDEIMVALSGLSEPDRAAALDQRICPVTKLALGSMGAPPRVEVNSEAVFICCEACERRLVGDPDRFLANLKQNSDPGVRRGRAALAALPAEDRVLAERQRLCPVADLPLGSMGTPPKVDLGEEVVFICCERCRTRLVGDPDRYLAKLRAVQANSPRPSAPEADGDREPRR